MCDTDRRADDVRVGPRAEEAPLIAWDQTMPKMRKKSDLPTKTCVVCKLPFTWRKKWERDWAEVSHCSDRCRKAGKAGTPRTGGA